MTRRQFAFWIGFGLFSLGDKFRVAGLDSLAAAAMRRSETIKSAAKRSGGEHWTVASSKKWRWFERESLINSEWVLTGTTTPVDKETGERKAENIGYLDDSLVPAEMRGSQAALGPASVTPLDSEDHEHPATDLDSQLPAAKRRARHGRPPSKWLRNLNAEELRVWLETVEVPDAGVSGMTVWTHLTRDHSFDEANLEGLEEPELHKLHAAAHFGY